MNPVTKIEIYLVVGTLFLLTWVASVGGAYLYGRHDGTTICEAKQANQQVAATKADVQEAIDAAKAAAATAKAAADRQALAAAAAAKAQGDLKDEIKKNARYSVVCFPDDAERLRYDAISAGRPYVPNSAPGLKLDPALSGGVRPPAPGRDGGQRNTDPPKRKDHL